MYEEVRCNFFYKNDNGIHLCSCVSVLIVRVVEEHLDLLIV